MPQPNLPSGNGDWSGKFNSGMKKAVASRDASEGDAVTTKPASVVTAAEPIAAPATAGSPVTATVLQPVPVPPPAPALPAVAAEVPVPPTTEPLPVAEPKQRIVKASKDDLIELPGQKPKSAEQLARENSRIRDLQRKESDLQKWENELRLRSAQPVPQPVREEPKPQAPQLTAPVLPANALPGDPEHSQYLVELGTFEAYKRMQPTLDSIQADIRSRNERDEQTRTAQETAQRTVQHNQAIYADGLGQLPFDLESLTPESAEAVFARIQEVAAPIIDFRNGGHAKALTPGEMQLIINAAYPPGSNPPGYEYYQEPDAIAALRAAEGPVVEPPKPQPMHAPNVPSINMPHKPAMPNPSSQSWEKRLESTFNNVAR